MEGTVKYRHQEKGPEAAPGTSLKGWAGVRRRGRCYVFQMKHAGSREDDTVSKGREEAAMWTGRTTREE